MPDPFDRFRLAGRTALVTGARREIGRAIATALAGAGARLAIHHAGTPEEAADADGVVREIEQAGGTARAFGQDFALDDSGHRLAAAVGAWSAVDILVLNARSKCPRPTRRSRASTSTGRSRSTCAALSNSCRRWCRRWPGAAGAAS
jgi:NAD(P)-dependent dehydrogenase (short-subunit alcohol dehydrogenase family)